MKRMMCSSSMKSRRMTKVHRALFASIILANVVHQSSIHAIMNPSRSARNQQHANASHQLNCIHHKILRVIHHAVQWIHLSALHMFHYLCTATCQCDVQPMSSKPVHYMVHWRNLNFFIHYAMGQISANPHTLHITWRHLKALSLISTWGSFALLSTRNIILSVATVFIHG